MKPHAFFLLLVAVLSCRAQNSTAATTANSPVQTASPQPAQGGAAAVAPTKPSDAAVRAEPAAADVSKTATLTKSEMQPTMGAVVVSGAAELKPAAPDLGTSLADLRAQQKASITQQLVDDAQSRKAAFAGVLSMQQPTLSPPKLTNPAVPAVALDAKNRTADLFNTK
jgi:hypothetical protein